MSIYFIFKNNKDKAFKKKRIEPDEVLLDSLNLPEFDTDQFEGRVSFPIDRKYLKFIGIFFFVIIIIFLYRLWDLQVVRGSEFALISESNKLSNEIVFAKRGIIYDRNGYKLAWNVSSEYSFLKRAYTGERGFAHILGFIGYPKKDKSGNWWRTEYVGKSGVERSFNDILSGENGLKIIEVDAMRNILSANTVRKPVDGDSVYLSIDKDLQSVMYDALRGSSERMGYMGGSMVVIDVSSGELFGITSYPEFDSNIMSEGRDREKIKFYANNKGKHFLNRAISAVYAPGSIIKPYVAVAALSEGIISEWKQIYSSGALIVPNPFHPDKPSRFLDWKAHGLVNMREAIAVSSNIYFYAIGGGLLRNSGIGTQEGLGIDKLAEYARRFGFGRKTGISLYGEKRGNVPTKEWKKETFGEDWLLGNTYHSSIGQYGWLVTPIQAAIYAAAMANGGYLLTPSIIKDSPVKKQNIGIKDKYIKVAREGMRLAVTEGTLRAVNYKDVKIAAKTGTAQIGNNNEFKNSWVVGFWPYEKPRFAFALVLERAPASASYGAVNALKNFFDTLIAKDSSYIK